MNKQNSEKPQSGVLFKDRLLGEALDALSTLYSAGRRLVAFTGSGLSLIYGGLTWNEAVMAIMEDTLAELTAALNKAPSSQASRQILIRHRRMIEVFMPGRPGSALKDFQHQDKMVALEVCESARATLKRQGHDVSSANAFFAALVQDDSIATEMRLADRMNNYASDRDQLEPLDRRNKRRDTLEALLRPLPKANGVDQAQLLTSYAAQTYSFATLKDCADHLPELKSEIDSMSGVSNRQTV